MTFWRRSQSVDEPAQGEPAGEERPLEGASPAGPEAPPAALDAGLQRTRGGFVSRLRGLFRGDWDADWEAVEAILIQGDVGPSLAMEVVERARRRRDVDGPEDAVRAELSALLAPRTGPWSPRRPVTGPAVILVVGVNGTGKTTTIGKLAHALRQDGKKVVLAAGDTFRAAAVEQLKIWGERTGSPVIAGTHGADAAGLCYDALETARRENADAVLIDTAGRLHNKADLMAELEKVVRVIRKVDPGAPHDCLLVLDATTGQNALAQVETFRSMTPVNGLVVTKLDGSAKGGVLVALAEKFGLPVRAIGVGEGVDDLRPFDGRAFARGLMGLPD